MDAPRQPDASFGFGYMDMRDATGTLGWLALRRLDAPDEKCMFYTAVRRGMFYNSGFERGVYVLDEFGTNGNPFQPPTVYGGNRQSNPVTLEIDKPGIYFIGAWRCVTSGGGLFEASKFDILPATKPTEKEILAEIIPFTEGNGWHDDLVTHYQELS